MKKNKGFVSTTLIYTFFILFLLLMLMIINSYSKKRIMLDQYKSKIRTEMYELYASDLNLYINVWDNESNDYELVNDLSDGEYEYEDISYCKYSDINDAIDYKSGKIIVKTNKKDFCYAYFKPNSN